MNICIFCSANDLNEKYATPARQLAEQIGRAGHALVWGGADFGLMRVVADGVRAGGGRLISVSIEEFMANDRQDPDEMIIAKDLAERKTIMLERADAIITLVGGLGTLDEATEVLELKKESMYNKPIIVLNSHGFYDSFRTQLERIADEGLLPPIESTVATPKTLAELIHFADTPEGVLELISRVGPAAEPAAV